eukprot:7698214-Pyramimonas_sp.AAC.1
MKTNGTGILCVTHSMRRGAGHLPDVIRGERSVVFYSGMVEGARVRRAPSRERSPGTADKSRDVKNTNEN